MSAAVIACNRYGLGIRPGEPLPGQPRDWLLAQCRPSALSFAAGAALPSTSDLLLEYRKRQRAISEAAPADQPAMRQTLSRDAHGQYLDAVDARLAQALDTPAPFAERLVHFWSNHFAVSGENPRIAALAGAYEAQAIRPHVLGRFEDLLFAAIRHPAMMLYLDQAASVGPDSKLAQRQQLRNPQQRHGLNENLAREVMELHTLGVRTGYTQADVTELARALTGWRIAVEQPDGFQFQPATHQPGERVVRGRRYAEGGEEQAVAILRDIAASPATARHIATKLARHFVSDNPPPALIDRLAVAFLRSGGELPTVYRTLIESSEAWNEPPAKFKSPWEWTVSSMRAMERKGFKKSGQAAFWMQQLGQPVWRPGSPAGYDDLAASWAAPDTLLRRVEAAQRLAVLAEGDLDPRNLAARVLPGRALSVATAGVVARADSPRAGLALLLVAPDFLRR